jgi:signal transduction histidine kinase
LILHTGKQGFVAHLGSREGFLANLLPGSWVELTGVYVSQNNGPAAGRVSSFELLLNSPADIVVLEQPGWWTLERLLAVLGALVAVLISALLWVFSLKRQVDAQAEVIRQKAESEATMEERTRIAREIHDTLEQFLAGTNLQLNALAVSLHDMPPESRRTLDLARSMVRHGQEEARRTVRNLRLLSLDNHNLPTALNQMIAQFKNGSTTNIQASLKGVHRTLSIQVESYLLRIGQEATTNAVKHARASAIGLELAYDEDAVQLTVQDDGCGFDVVSAASGESGHFGLLGMRERTEKIGGTLEIRSNSGQGTILQVKVPVTPSGSAEARSDSVSI